MKTLLIALMMLVSFSVIADARPHHRSKHYIHERSIKTDKIYNKSTFGWGGSSLIAKARSYMGATASMLGLRRNKWCAAFLNKLTGSGTDERAISYASRGRPAGRGCVGCIAVVGRHHVGIVSGYDPNGNPTIISGNHNRRVGEGTYSAHRILAYRWVE